MTIERFNQLAPGTQLLVVMSQGTRLAIRQHRQFMLTLYYVPNGGRGFFAEVGVNESLQRIVVLRSSSSSVLLEDYTYEVQLPDL